MKATFNEDSCYIMAIKAMKINLGGERRHKKLLQKATHSMNSNLKATHTFKTNLRTTRGEGRTNLADLKTMHAMKTNTKAKPIA